jgi:hypothetical protein
VDVLTAFHRLGVVVVGLALVALGSAP